MTQLLSLSEAARRAGVDRSTIYRKLKQGALSATIGPDNARKIELAELLRLYPGADTETTDRTPRGKPERTTGEKAAEINSLQRELNAAREQVADLRRDRDRQVEDLRGERDRLLSIVENQTRLLADQRDRGGLFSWWRRAPSRKADSES